MQDIVTITFQAPSDNEVHMDYPTKARAMAVIAPVVLGIPEGVGVEVTVASVEDPSQTATVTAPLSPEEAAALYEFYLASRGIEVQS